MQRLVWAVGTAGTSMLLVGSLGACGPTILQPDKGSTGSEETTTSRDPLPPAMTPVPTTDGHDPTDGPPPVTESDDGTWPPPVIEDFGPGKGCGALGSPCADGVFECCSDRTPPTECLPTAQAK